MNRAGSAAGCDNRFMVCYCAGMRGIALVAFVALQLSMFACGLNIHVHHIDAGDTYIAQQDGKAGSSGTTLLDTACQIHASHVFLDDSPHQQGAPSAFAGQGFALAALAIVNIPHRIEHPPKPSYS